MIKIITGADEPANMRKAQVIAAEYKKPYWAGSNEVTEIPEETDLIVSGIKDFEGINFLSLLAIRIVLELSNIDAVLIMESQMEEKTKKSVERLNQVEIIDLFPTT